MNYFAFEGIDCLGKSTQLELLKLDFLNKPTKEFYKSVKFVKEPGQTNLGVKLREIILNEKISKKAELFLFLADRAELFSSIDFSKDFVISDRSLISHLAYAPKQMYDDLLKFNLFATDGILPNYVVFFKANSELLANRLALKRLDEIEKRGVEYFMQVQENFVNILKDLNINTLEIDASLSIKDINTKIKEYINDNCN